MTLPLTQKPDNYDPQLLEWMRGIRQFIHQNPELSFQESGTATYIQKKLDELGIHYRSGIGGTGILAEIGPKDALVTVGLRADMDALPLTESTGLSFASTTTGRMHACGHDGHIAILLGAARILLQMDLPCRVRLLFQPAEERGNGALAMIEAGAIDGLAAIFSGHIDTHYSTETITVDEGIICAFADPFEIKLHGRSGHAARPHETKDAIVAAAGLITSLQSLIAREVDPNQSAVLTVGRIRAGETHNIIADEAIIEGTIRSTHPEARQQVLEGLRRMVQGNASLYGVTTDLEFMDGLPAVINRKLATTVAQAAAEAVVPEQNVISQGPSSLGGEDFAFYLQKIEGCMVRFGARLTDETGPAHSPTFDFDENVLAVGAAWYAQVILQFCANRKNSEYLSEVE
jgi:hippurate hydrolase